MLSPSEGNDSGDAKFKLELRMLSVCVQFLEHYKLELARRRFGPTTGVDEPPAKKARIELDQTYSGITCIRLHSLPSFEGIHAFLQYVCHACLPMICVVLSLIMAVEGLRSCVIPCLTILCSTAFTCSL